MKKLFIGIGVPVLFVFCATFSYAVSISRLQDKVVEYATATVNGQIAWTPAEREALITALSVFSGTAPVTVVHFAPTALEEVLASGVLGYENYSDFVNSADIKAHVQDKLDDVRPSIARKQSAALAAIRVENNKR